MELGNFRQEELPDLETQRLLEVTLEQLFVLDQLNLERHWGLAHGENNGTTEE